MGCKKPSNCRVALESLASISRAVLVTWWAMVIPQGIRYSGHKLIIVNPYSRSCGDNGARGARGMTSDDIGWHRMTIPTQNKNGTVFCADYHGSVFKGADPSYSSRVRLLSRGFFLGVTVAMNCFNHSPGSRNVGFSHKSCWEPEKHELDGCSCGNVVVLPNKKRRLSWKLQIQRFDANSMQSQCWRS